MSKDIVLTRPTAIEIGDIPTTDLIEAAESAGEYYFDLETTGLNPREDRIEGIAIYIPKSDNWPATRAWYPFVNGTMRMTAKVKKPDGKTKKKPVNFRPAMPLEETMEGLRPLFLNEDLIGIAHNGKFDMKFLHFACGCEDPIEIKSRYADSMVADYIADERRKAYGLKRRVEQVFGHKMTTYNDAKRKSQTMLSFAIEKPLGVYAMDDCEWGWRLYCWAMELMRKQDEEAPRRAGRTMGQLERIFWNIEMKLTRIIMEMEMTGVLIDWAWLEEVEKDLLKQMDDKLSRLEEITGGPINPASPKQVSDLLFAQLGLPTDRIEKGKSGYYATGTQAIRHLMNAHEAVRLTLDWRSLDTNRGNFATKLIELCKGSDDSRCYSHFNQTRTVIGRLSSSDPVNLQNQPRKRNFIRKAFCARLPAVNEEEFKRRVVAEMQAYKHMIEQGLDVMPDGLRRVEDVLKDPTLQLYGADYGQVELRVAAHLSRDEAMLEVYNNIGDCKGNDGDVCDRYKLWLCNDCDKQKREGKLFVPSHGWDVKACVCPTCGGQDVEHQARCRHVDLHQRTAEDADVPRNPLAKNCNFGLLYRMGAPKFCTYADLWTADGHPDLSYAKDVIRRWHAAYPRISDFHDWTEEQLHVNDWIAYTLTGRRRRLDQERHWNEYEAVTKGIQFQVSGTAQDIIKVAMIHIAEERDRNIANSRPVTRRLWEKTRFLIQVHDEVLLQAPIVLQDEVCDLIKRNMEGAAKLSVPLTCDVKYGVSWDDVH